MLVSNDVHMSMVRTVLTVFCHLVGLQLNVLMDTLDQSQQGALSKAGDRQAVARQIKQAARGHRQPALTLTRECCMLNHWTACKLVGLNYC